MSQGKKRKLVTEISDKPSQARKSRPGLVSKRRKPVSFLRFVDESIAEGIPEKETRVDDEEADVQRELEESLKSIYDAPRGPLPSVVIREPEFGKYQPLPEVQGKGKAKVTDEQVARDLLTLQKPKKRAMLINISFKGAPPHLLDPLDVPKIDAGVQGEGQAGPNPDDQAEGQAGPNPGDATASQPLPSPVVHTRPNLEHMDLDVADVSTQPHPEQMDEGFTATAYLKSRGRKHKANVSKNEKQQKNQPEIKKPKKVGFIKRLATPNPRKLDFSLGGHQMAKCLTKMENLLFPVTPRVMLTALMVIMLVPLTLWNLKSNDFQILFLCLAGYPDLFVVRRF
nr:hypothetical protein [Tanacetum cinerariifolium]